MGLARRGELISTPQLANDVLSRVPLPSSHFFTVLSAQVTGNRTLKQDGPAYWEHAKVILTEHSTIAPQLTELDELSRQMMDVDYAFDSAKNDEFFYLPPDTFNNPSFQIDLRYFVSPDGKSARYLIYHDGEALTPEGITHDQTYLPAAKEALKGTTLAGARVYLGGAAATYWDIQDATRTDLIIAATAAFALIFLVMLLITRSIIAALVIIGTVALSYSGAFGLSVLIWQHFLGIPLSWRTCHSASSCWWRSGRTTTFYSSSAISKKAKPV